MEAQATLDTIVDRLPSYMRTKWVDKANEKRKRDERASFDTLREFIADRARALRSSHGKHYIEKLNATASNTSVSSKSSQQSKKQTKQGKQIATTTTLTTQSSATQPSSKPAGSALNTDKKRECVFCNKTDHHVSECSGFTKASLSDRTNFVKEKHLCYNCLHVGHGTYVCRNKARCTKCNRKHHDLIHDDAFIKKENNEETSTPSATISCTLQSRNVYLRTLPVRISNGDKEIIAVALLDGGAQSSLGTEDLFNKLGINERPSNLKLTTVTGETTEYKSMSANITVKPLDCSHSVAMEYVRSIPKLPIAKSCSAKKQDIKNIDHLKDIPIATME